MWLQHRFGHSLLGNEETTTNPPTQRTIEFSPNYELQGTKLDTTIGESFTDIEAAAGSDMNKEGSSILGSKEVFLAQ